MTADSVSWSSVSRAAALTALCVIFGCGEDASIGRYTAMIERTLATKVSQLAPQLVD